MAADVVVFNPLSVRLGHYEDEELRAQWAGRDVVIGPGKKIRMSATMGNHVLQHLGPRGLRSLQFGDDEDIRKIAQEGQRQNITFKEQQVVKFNSINMRQKGRNLDIIPVTESMRKMSRDVKIPLAGGYESGQSENRKAMMDLEMKLEEEKKEKVALQDMILNLNTKMSNLEAKFDGTPHPADVVAKDDIDYIEDDSPAVDDDAMDEPEDVTFKEDAPPVIDTQEIVDEVSNRFKRLSLPDLESWINNNLDNFEVWPSGVVTALEAKWERVGNGKKFPLEQMMEAA